jgi:uncharacterized protein YcbK (DUF882 family)
MHDIFDEFIYFDRFEFRCECCEGIEIDTGTYNLFKMLNEARWLYGKPITINSGYRCPAHNKAVGGKHTSSHLRGLAVDIDCPNSSERYRLVQILLAVGFNRIGIGEDFIHVDVDISKISRVIWTY